ncbi:sigma-like protein [Streptomyces sp. NPDC014846]|uniref:sigma-like protein n=1 Tax=unclassified Streptomyces TaxID=2593676 RepID=UPI0036F5C85A
MSKTEKQPTDITTMENHSPAPPADINVPKQQGTTPAPSADTEITTMENHSPAPPALDLDRK